MDPRDDNDVEDKEDDDDDDEVRALTPDLVPARRRRSFGCCVLRRERSERSFAWDTSMG